MASIDDSPPDFPRARQGYHRSSVDSYLGELTELVESLRRESTAQRDQIQQLRESVSHLQAKNQRLESASIDERAQDILDDATQQAATRLATARWEAEELVTQAEREAEVVEERARQEIAWRRRQLGQERDELAKQRLAVRTQLSSFRDLATDTEEHFPELRELSRAQAGAGSDVGQASEQHL